MNIYRHWAKATKTVSINGRDRKFACYGGSNLSENDAHRDATLRLDKMIDRIRSGQELERYAYTDRPLREEIVEELQDGGETVAILTRNIYGAVVLNTSNILFADIDHQPDQSPRSGGGEIKLTDLLSKIPFLAGNPLVKSVIENVSDEPGQRTKQKIESLCADNPNLGFRLYETAQGYRCILTSQAIEPLSNESRQLLVALDSDPLYITLCESHQCYRARLTPKPWRCNSAKPPSRFPFESPQIESTYRKWQANYETQAANFSVCRFVQSFGNPEMVPLARTMIELHDTMSVGELKLA